MVLLLIIQFVLPFSYYNERGLNAFESYKNLESFHWIFYYFFFIIFIVVAGLTLYILHTFDKRKFSYWFDFILWNIGCWGQVAIGALFQNFVKANPDLGIKDESKTLAISVFLAMTLLIISLRNLMTEYDKKAEVKMDKRTPRTFYEYLEDRKVLYEDTILLNPKRIDFITHPYPKRIALTNNEIVISTDPLTIIPYESIKEIKMDKDATFCIRRFDGRKHRLTWAPAEKYFPYDGGLTRELYDLIKAAKEGNFLVFEEHVKDVEEKGGENQQVAERQLMEKATFHIPYKVYFIQSSLNLLITMFLLFSFLWIYLIYLFYFSNGFSYYVTSIFGIIVVIVTLIIFIKFFVFTGMDPIKWDFYRNFKESLYRKYILENLRCPNCDSKFEGYTKLKEYGWQLGDFSFRCSNCKNEYVPAVVWNHKGIRTLWYLKRKYEKR